MVFDIRHRRPFLWFIKFKTGKTRCSLALCLLMRLTHHLKGSLSLIEARQFSTVQYSNCKNESGYDRRVQILIHNLFLFSWFIWVYVTFLVLCAVQIWPTFFRIQKEPQQWPQSNESIRESQETRKRWLGSGKAQRPGTEPAIVVWLSDVAPPCRGLNTNTSVPEFIVSAVGL